jgi:hypothetical protein
VVGLPGFEPGTSCPPATVGARTALISLMFWKVTLRHSTSLNVITPDECQIWQRTLDANHPMKSVRAPATRQGSRGFSACLRL